MPNATLRANARAMPKSAPKPGSVESITHQTAHLRSATALLKTAQVAERELAEPNAADALLASVDQLKRLKPDRRTDPNVFGALMDLERPIRELKRTTGRPYRLLSEAEWEYAARGCRNLKCAYGRRR